MIVTVTMNPAIDKTVELDTFRRGNLNRIQRVEYDAGGKGINVSKTIRELGGETIATGFLGGNGGRTIEHVLKENGISCDFVWVDGETRTNTKVFEANGILTELNEPGPMIFSNKLRELLDKLDSYAKEDTLFVLSGSVPFGMDKGIYGEIIQRVHQKGAKVFLDADGELFEQAIPAKPDMIKPNRMELERFAGLDEDVSEDVLFRMAEILQKDGIGQIAVSMGDQGALFLMDGKKMKCPALSINAHSPVGAGDAMVAAMCYAWEQKLSTEETVMLAMAVSAGAVTTIGTKPPSKKVVQELMQQVEIENL